MKFYEAVEQLVQDQYTDWGKGYYKSPVVFALASTQVSIAYRVFECLEDDSSIVDIEFGTFDNCREYGLTVTAGDWTFCAYEHRNSDQIHIEGCPTTDIQEWGPYGGDDKFDTLAHYGWQRYESAASGLRAAVRAAQNRVGENMSRIYVRQRIRLASSEYYV